MSETASKWREMVEQKAFRGKLWAAFGLEQVVRKLWECLTIKQAWTRSVLADAQSERQNGTDGRWQQETPYREELGLVRHSSALCLGCILMCGAYCAVKSGDWENSLEEFSRDGTPSTWASVNVRES